MDVLEAIFNRRSHRVYKKDQLPDDVLDTILNAGLAAPSAKNRQPWHFTVVQDADLIQEVHEETVRVRMLTDKNPRFREPDFQVFFYAPTVIFIFGDTNVSWTPVDCGIAVENMALAAEGLGVGSVILGWPLAAFKGDKADYLRDKLQCPEGYDYVVALSLGYATDHKDAHYVRDGHISRIV